MKASICLPFFAASLVFGHAVVDDPAPRKTGSSQEALCGSVLTKAFESDIAGPIENAVSKAVDPYSCNPYLCRGYQFEDNTDNVRSVQAGDVIHFHVDLIAGHRPGYANTSIIDTATNTVIGEPLRSWDEWPGQNTGSDREDINFNVTIPAGLEETCGEAGKCVIQWYWYATKNKQTYESCLDIQVS
ncbi:unnamed protein product [Clonostachys chloroleuca]|uniref:Chitin-binding type-4 domain-containing protein n=1 Tax=Clonostachys chloroleuca TaxID=1926264 RepID=A0AA35Q2N4_9HYPO|nr:unnamed protein product [Clonostachys chloroleuca]